MKKIIIFNILFTVLVVGLASIRCATINPFLWGWGTISFVFFCLPVGLLVITSFVDEDLKKVSHWAVYGLVVLTTLFVIFEIFYPGLKH